MASETGKKKAKVKQNKSNGQVALVPERHTIEMTFDTYLADAYTTDEPRRMMAAVLARRR